MQNLAQGAPKTPCPACDVRSHGHTPLMALAYGAAIGVAFGDLHPITERMCDEHRPTWLMAMMAADIACNTVDDEPAPESAPCSS